MWNGISKSTEHGLLYGCTTGISWVSICRKSVQIACEIPWVLSTLSLSLSLSQPASLRTQGYYEGISIVWWVDQARLERSDAINESAEALLPTRGRHEGFRYYLLRMENTVKLRVYGLHGPGFASCLYVHILLTELYGKGKKGCIMMTQGRIVIYFKKNQKKKYFKRYGIYGASYAVPEKSGKNPENAGVYQGEVDTDHR
jgi:hypothetical protein